MKYLPSVYVSELWTGSNAADTDASRGSPTKVVEIYYPLDMSFVPKSSGNFGGLRFGNRFITVIESGDR